MRMWVSFPRPPWQPLLVEGERWRREEERRIFAMSPSCWSSKQANKTPTCALFPKAEVICVLVGMAVVAAKACLTLCEPVDRSMLDLLQSSTKTEGKVAGSFRPFVFVRWCGLLCVSMNMYYLCAAVPVVETDFWFTAGSPDEPRQRRLLSQRPSWVRVS